MGPGPTITSPPPMARLPVMARRQILACSTLMELRPSMSVALPQWKPAGQLVAYMRADSRMTSGETQVISATLSGVYSAARARSSSKPKVHCSTKDLSYRPSSMITLIQAMKRAVSVPGRNCTQMSANLPASVRRGSMTMSLRSPSAMRFLSRWKSSGAVSLRLHPSMTRHLTLGSFGLELVMPRRA